LYNTPAPVVLYIAAIQNQYKSIMKTTGIVIIIIGILLTIFTAFSFFTKEKVVEIGKLEITRDKPHNINWSPLIGIAVIGAGGIILWRSAKRSV